LCDRDFATNFGDIAGEVILVDSCAIIFICFDCYLFFWKKKRETEFLLAAVLFKTNFLMELGIILLFPEGK
jgi:hypothetical protein